MGESVPHVREAAVAGRFYPGERDALREVVDTLTSSVEVPDDDVLCPAYVVPHAGYRFSGPTAGHVYARLRRHAGSIDRVLLIGPAHFVRMRGCAVPTTDRWATPLGEVAVDADGRDDLVEAGHASTDDAPHAPEHSLEVQLPFLQRALRPGVPVLPVVAGPSTVDHVSGLLAEAYGEGTVLLCSTDLSHYQDDTTARELDAGTVAAVCEREPDRIGSRDACGVFALRGLTALAARFGWAPQLLDYSTSADTAGSPERVVGYAAFALAR